MPVKIGGLPAHVLLVHAVIVLLPLAAVMVVAAAVWPAARAKLGFLTPAVAFVALVLVPVTTNAGNWLRDHLQGAKDNPQITKHMNLGNNLWPWALGVFILAAVLWLLGRSHELSWRPADGGVRRASPVWLTAVVAVVAVGVSVGTIIQLYRVGEAGSKAVWPPGITTG